MASKASQLFGWGIFALASSSLAQEITISETADTQDVITTALANESASNGDVLVFSSESPYNFSGQVSTNLNLALRGSPPGDGPPPTILRKTTNARFFAFSADCGGTESGIRNLQFIGESVLVTNGPGAIYVSQSLLGSIEDSIFSRNYSTGPGGAVYINNFDGDIINSLFSGNYSASTGGAVFAGNFAGSIESSIFSGNHTPQPGGAIFAANLSENIKDSIFFKNSSGTFGGAVCVMNANGITESFCDLGGSKFLSNSSVEGGGAITVVHDGYLGTLSGDVIFQGNKDTGLPDAIFYENYDSNNNIGLAATSEKTFYLYDPMSSDSSRRALTIAINPESAHMGTVLLDRYRSDVYYENPSGATVSHGTLALHNGASFGASDNNGTFTLQSDATLRLAYDQETRVFDCEIGESGSYTVTESAYVPDYDPASTVSKIFAGKVNLNGRVNFFLPKNVEPGNSMLIIPGAVEFQSATFSVGMVECPEEIDVGDSVVLIHSEQEIANSTDYTQEPSPLRGEFSAFGYYFELSTPSPYELCATLRLADPESTIWSESYYGESSESMPESTLWSESYYSESMTESMTESVPESANLTESDFGSESGPNVESEVVPESVVAPELEPPAAQPGGYQTGIILLNHCGDLIGDFGETVLTKPFNLYGVLHCGVERHRCSSPQEVGFRSLLAGFNFCGDTGPALWSGGAFLESGFASFHRVRGAGKDSRGEGSCNCLGGGIVLRGLLKFDDRNHFSVEASGRLGRIENRWSSSNLLGFSGPRTVRDDYGGAHGGVGYRISGSKLTMDLYGKYFWVELASKSLEMENGIAAKFQEIYSSRARLGGRVSLPSIGRLCPYGGAAWEREFRGEGDVLSGGALTALLSLRGTSAMGELGFRFQFNDGARTFRFDGGLRAYCGARRGARGTLHATYEF